jgi:hypothetical protein
MKIRANGVSRPIHWVRAMDEQIPGGESSGMSMGDAAPDQIIAGAAVELEHTGDWRTALEIAKDHLSEDPAYYSNVIPSEEVESALSKIIKSVAGGGETETAIY